MSHYKSIGVEIDGMIYHIRSVHPNGTMMTQAQAVSYAKETKSLGKGYRTVAEAEAALSEAGGKSRGS